MSNQTSHFLSIRSVFAVSCFVFAALVPSGTATVEGRGPSIERVDFSVLNEEPERHAPEMLARRHLMFEKDEQPVGERYAVRWSPAPGGTPAGTEVVFEYRQSRDNRIRTLRIRYPFKVTSTRTARFTIQGKAYGDRGPVTAWHVRLMQADRTLASRSSAYWSKAP